MVLPALAVPTHCALQYCAFVGLFAAPAGLSVRLLLCFTCRDSPLVDMAQKFMLERVVVPAASQLGLAAEYEYLRPSIEAFPIGRYAGHPLGCAADPAEPVVCEGQSL